MKPYVTSIERIGIEKGRAQGLSEGLTQGLSQGLTQGLSQGLSQGQQQGQIRMLQKLLSKRFGAVPIWAEKRIVSAQPEQLEDWSLRVLDGKSLEEVLGVNETPAGYGDGGEGRNKIG